jgi:lipopolysaccharide/colanic/teichoic acid biosynthesis glycosyltransferase
MAAIAIKLSSRGGVVFRQTRIGRDGSDFQMLKFRTMVIGADKRKHELLEHNEASPLFKIANDQARPRWVASSGASHSTSYRSCSTCWAAT